MNGGRPTVAPLTQAQLLARLTGAATLAAGALLYGVGTSQPATLALGTPGQVLVAGATAPAWSDTFTTAKTINVSSGTIQTWQIAGATKMVLDGSGNLGIGVTPTVNGRLQIQSAASGGAPQTTGTTDANTVARLGAGSVALDIGVYAAGQMWIQQRSQANFATNYGIVLQPNGGNVSIGGTSSSGYGLDIIKASGGAGFRAYSGANICEMTVNGVDTYITNGQAGKISFYNNGSERLAIDSSGNATFAGNVGVGASTGSKFSVVDNTAGSLTYTDIQNASLTGTGGSILRLISGNAAGTTTTSLGIVKYRTGPVYFSNNESNAAGVIIFQTASADVLTLGVDKSSTFAGIVKSVSGAIFGTDPGFTENVRFGSTIRFAGNLSIQGGVNFLFDATTGSQLGSANTQKIGFWGATPVGQYNTTGTSVGFTAGAGTAVKDDSTFTGNTGATAYRISDVVRALKFCGIMAS